VGASKAASNQFPDALRELTRLHSFTDVSARKPGKRARSRKDGVEHRRREAPGEGVLWLG